MIAEKGVFSDLLLKRETLKERLEEPLFQQEDKIVTDTVCAFCNSNVILDETISWYYKCMQHKVVYCDKCARNSYISELPIYDERVHHCWQLEKIRKKHGLKKIDCILQKKNLVVEGEDEKDNAL